jgi:hypothetical protein
MVDRRSGKPGDNLDDPGFVSDSIPVEEVIGRGFSPRSR